VGSRIPDEDIDRVREAVDIVEVIGAHLPLKRSGKSYKALCPFHSEKTPSFHVFPESQIFKCFGCGKGGNVFHFLMGHEKMEFPEAVKFLADRAGVSIRETGGGPQDASSRERQGILDALRAAASHFRSNLKSEAGAEARAYLEKREVTAQTADRFLLGYALAGWDGCLKALAGDVRESYLEEGGLLVTSRSGGKYDRFRNRLVFPICDARGRVVGFGGRVLPGADEGAPKYVNTPETSIYRKSRLLYGLHLAREEDLRGEGVVMVEGYTDVILLHQAGIRNAVATCGTALTPEHVSLLKRYTDRLSLVFDGDEAGVAAMERGLDVLVAEDMDISVVILPAGEDPADFVASRGGESFRDAVSGGRDLFDFKLETAVRKEDVTTSAGLSRAADEVLALIRRVRNPVKRESFLHRASEGLGVSRDALSSRLRQGPKRVSPLRSRRAPSSSSDARARCEGWILEALLGDASLFARAREEMPSERFEDPTLREAARRAFEVFDRSGRVVLAQVIQSEPEGAFKEVSERIFEQEMADCLPEYKKLYEDGLEEIARLNLKTRKGALQSALKEAEASGDRERKRALLEELVALSCQIESKSSGQ